MEILTYIKAYGLADIESHWSATTSMIYSIGSINKQFTAASILLLAEEGKLSLDDSVGRWLPSLTRANEVTIRQMLSMTSGYQDYMATRLCHAFNDETGFAGGNLEKLGGKSRSISNRERNGMYSNTNYVAAGAIVERLSGMSVLDFLHCRVFDGAPELIVCSIAIARLSLSAVLDFATIDMDWARHVRLRRKEKAGYLPQASWR